MRDFLRGFLWERGQFKNGGDVILMFVCVCVCVCVFNIKRTMTGVCIDLQFIFLGFVLVCLLNIDFFNVRYTG